MEKVPKLINNENAKQYELEAEGLKARIEYIIAKDNVIYLTHTEVPKPLEGKGVGSSIVKLTLEDIKSNGLQLMPLCPFVAAYIKRHPEWNEILMKGVKLK